MEHPNITKLKALNWWQSNPNIHEYTCSNPKEPHTGGVAMIPAEVDGKVVLRCPICKHIQTHGLEHAYHFYKDKDKLEREFKNVADLINKAND